jgi:hypothetical protein
MISDSRDYQPPGTRTIGLWSNGRAASVASRATRAYAVAREMRPAGIGVLMVGATLWPWVLIVLAVSAVIAIEHSW